MRRKLADASRANRAWRRKILASFRDPDYSTMEPDLVPALYGDKIAIPPNLVQPRQWMAVSPLQYAHLRAWAEGNFTDAGASSAMRLSDMPVAKQPDALDRASLGACLGGAFHPGIEFTWLARIPWIWTADMRLKWTQLEPNVDDYGPLMTQNIALSRSGPLSTIGPGSIGQWMGLPWHSDSASCRSGYSRATSPVSPTFWPARIPNQVLAEEDYDVVMDGSRSLAERRAAFERRRGWERFVAGPTSQTAINAMIADWYKLGVVAELPGPKDGFRERLHGDGWVAVGDAAVSVDPLSSQGLITGVVMAAHAARLAGADLADWETSYRAVLAEHEETRGWLYAVETRWPNADFWSRRAPTLGDPVIR